MAFFTTESLESSLDEFSDVAVVVAVLELAWLASSWIRMNLSMAIA